MNKEVYILLALTVWLVLIGCVLYAVDSVGWAQFCWVLASGTAGGLVVKAIDKE